MRKRRVRKDGGLQQVPASESRRRRTFAWSIKNILLISTTVRTYIVHRVFYFCGPYLPKSCQIFTSLPLKRYSSKSESKSIAKSDPLISVLSPHFPSQTPPQPSASPRHDVCVCFPCLPTLTTAYYTWMEADYYSSIWQRHNKTCLCQGESAFWHKEQRICQRREAILL